MLETQRWGKDDLGVIEGGGGKVEKMRYGPHGIF